MVDINDVYQKVQVLCNKEQRGYITPQEFNLLADKAQKEIFEGYFSELSRQEDRLKSENDDGNIKNSLYQKLEDLAGVTTTTSYVSMGTSWRIGNAWVSETDATAPSAPVKKISQEEYHEMERHPFTKPSLAHPVMFHTYGRWQFKPTQGGRTYKYTYWSEPSTPKWNYVVVQGKALYNASGSNHFDLHRSEEELVVNRILELAGIVIMKPGIVELGSTGAAKIKTEQIK